MYYTYTNKTIYMYALYCWCFTCTYIYIHINKTVCICGNNFIKMSYAWVFIVCIYAAVYVLGMDLQAFQTVHAFKHMCVQMPDITIRQVQWVLACCWVTLRATPQGAVICDEKSTIWTVSYLFVCMHACAYIQSSLYGVPVSRCVINNIVSLYVHIYIYT